MTWPGIERQAPGLLANTLPIRTTQLRNKNPCVFGFEGNKLFQK